MSHLQQAVFTMQTRRWDSRGKWWLDPLHPKPPPMLGEKLLFMPHTPQVVYWWWTWRYVPTDAAEVRSRGLKMIKQAEPAYRHLEQSGGIESELVDFHCSDWPESYTSGDMPHTRAALHQPLFGGTLLLAGEHTSQHRYGYVDGAIESGVRVVREICRGLM